MKHEFAAFETSPEPESPEHRSEIERQFTTDCPAIFEPMKDAHGVELITHLYLSRPEEEFNLRISEVTTHGSTAYYATLKDHGQLTAYGLKRMEIETEVNEATFRFYEGLGDCATLRKLRVRPASGVTIDWYATDEPPIIEIEDGPDNQEAETFLCQFSPYLLEYTGHTSVSSEALAYRLSPDYRPATRDTVSVETITETLLAARAAGAGPIVAGIVGRSGSGKTTLAREVTKRLANDREAVPTVTQLSSDDYHRGKAWLEARNQGRPWQDWDASIVYDTAAMARDLAKLTNGETIPRRIYDFHSQEPTVEGIIEPSDIILVEGICSGSTDLAGVRDFLFTLPASAATSIGRRLKRDVTEGRLNSSLGSVEDILRYQLEYAEPAYLKRLAGR